MGNQEVIYHSFNIYNSRGHRCGFLAAVSGLPIATLLKPLRSSLYASFSVLLPTKNSSLYNRVRDRAMYTSIPIMEKALQKSFVPTLYFTSLFLFLIYLLWIMIQPFLGAVIFAAIITGSIYPLFIRLIEKTHISYKLAALIMCIAIIFVVFLPTILLVSILSKEAVILYQHLSTGFSNEMVNNFFFGDGYFSGLMQRASVLTGIEINSEVIKSGILGQIKSVSALTIKTVNNLVGNLVSFIFKFVIMILVIYALLAEGVFLKRFLLKLSPLPDDQEELIIEKFNQMNFVTLVCNGLGGLIQGVLAGIGFWFAGLSLIALWTTLMIILAFIPLLGISIIYIPACIYLAIIGDTYSSVILFTYCTLIALVTENWFKPMFIGKRIQINSLLVLLTIIGGMTVFGVGGIFYGPVIAILFLTTVELYHKFYEEN
ncbi:AI-2E family transporter [Methyloprofundus sp.]|uniref:AI-2E family transporter n=1 Tax=Methyloprofundus sp. TaxID=2020875 RepID=UPI003D0CD851